MAGSGFVSDDTCQLTRVNIWPVLRCPFAQECRQCLRAGVSCSAGAQDGSAVARGARKQGPSPRQMSKIVSLPSKLPAVNHHSQSVVAMADWSTG